MRTFLSILILVAAGFQTSHAAGRIRLDMSYERWSWDGADSIRTSLGETTTRLTAGIDLNRNLTFDLGTGWIGAGENLRSLQDTRMKLTYRHGDRLLLRFGLNVPTGAGGFSDAQFAVARALASRFIAFEGSRIGEGLDFDLGGSYAFTAGPAAIAVGAAYLMKGAYAPFREPGTYDPGNQMSLAGGVDFGGPALRVRSNVRAIFYTSDAFENVELFRIGDRIEAQIKILKRYRRTSLWTSGTVITYGRARIAGGGRLEPEAVRSQPTELYADMGARQVVNPRIDAVLTVSYRNFHGGISPGGSRADLGTGLEVLVAQGTRAGVQGDIGAGSLAGVFPEIGNRAGSKLFGGRIATFVSRDF